MSINPPNKELQVPTTDIEVARHEIVWTGKDTVQVRVLLKGQPKQAAAREWLQFQIEASAELLDQVGKENRALFVRFDLPSEIDDKVEMTKGKLVVKSKTQE